MPVSFILDPVHMVRPAFSDHFARDKIYSQVRALVRADGAAVERGDADAPDKSQDEQDSKPFSFKKEFYKFLDRFHVLGRGKVYRVRRRSPNFVHHTAFSVESNTLIGL